jgi:hypothetical protein
VVPGEQGALLMDVPQGPRPFAQQQPGDHAEQGQARRHFQQNPETVALLDDPRLQVNP